jgi:hypothetical protein
MKKVLSDLVTLSALGMSPSSSSPEIIILSLQEVYIIMIYTVDIKISTVLLNNIK